MQLALLSFTSDLEAIGDVIDRGLCHQVIKQDSHGHKLSAEDGRRLEEYYALVAHGFEMAINVLATRKGGLARQILQRKDAAKELFLRHQTEHYAALSDEGGKCFNGSSYFLDILNGLRRISGHLTSVGYHFSESTQGAQAGKIAPAATQHFLQEKEFPT